MARRKEESITLDRIKQKASISAAITRTTEPSPEPERPERLATERARVPVVMPRELKARWFDAAQRENVPPSDLARFALEAFLADYDADGPLTAEFRGRLVRPDTQLRLR